MMKKALYILGVAIALAACSKVQTSDESVERHGVVLNATIADFESEGQTKVNVEGTSFVAGDWIRIKIICPFVSDSQLGESSPIHVYDGFWLEKWTGSEWTNLEESDHCDLDGDFIDSHSLPLSSLMLVQGTPYVFTASTWSEEVSFIEQGATSPVLQFNNVFYADQSIERHYRCSDVLWAQEFYQTGPWHIDLEFKHVMAALDVTVIDPKDTIANDAVLTIEGMPDMDQRETVVGDYYAAKSKSNGSYGYKQKSVCDVVNNGKVLGVSYLDQPNRKAGVTPIASLPLTGTYKALRVGNKHWRFIVPPCALTTDAVLWLRSGNVRYSLTLSTPTFEQGKFYPVEMTIE